LIASNKFCYLVHVAVLQTCLGQDDAALVVKALAAGRGSLIPRIPGRICCPKSHNSDGVGPSHLCRSRPSVVLRHDSIRLVHWCSGPSLFSRDADPVQISRIHRATRNATLR
jgi:hypothetical protein